MIRELCHIVVKPGTQAGFEAAVHQALAIFKRSKGCHQVELHHVIEKPEEYMLIIHWEKLEDHLEGFRKSPDYQEWRGLVGGFFAQAPDVVHASAVI
ncbi:MAG: antibiotic biosynthesis monooxygenase [Castellaniella sp.]|uniref:antibiotic biosynthesis monooxygenase family protein n=1 Tax=Castellaniella sp. TaxID=1955812 RepID=UPI001212F6CC|nr:antibiotic biosynthesis monooxygenase family protein [Castellaniella sp.]TAN29108.1 MAG: antibiotic biosynthesis monooxygenase [Castellaniella sp.]